MMRRVLLLSLSLLCFVVASAQRTKRVTGTYTYYVPANVSLEEARHIALDRAKIAAIEEAFGSLVTQSNSTLVSNVNGETDSRFLSIGGSEVKGEWLETTREPIYNIRYAREQLVVEVTVEGIVRELTESGLTLTARLLRNGTEERFESSEFRNGDDLYLFFSAPTDGYLLAYLYDEATDRAVCLLPYSSDTRGHQPIRGGEQYLFFRSDNHTQADEYTLTTTHAAPEFATLYLIFSPSPIYMANHGVTTASDGLRSLSHKAFTEWLVKTRKSVTVKVIEKQIIVNP